MSVEQPAPPGVDRELVLGEGEELLLVTQGQELGGERPTEITLYVTSARLLTRAHSSATIRETVLFAEARTARLERRSMITGVVDFDSRRFMVPQVHGSHIIGAHSEYLALSQRTYPSIPFSHQHDVESAVSLMLRAMEPVTEQEQFLNSYLALLSLESSAAEAMSESMSHEAWLSLRDRATDRVSEFMTLVGYLLRKQEIDVSRSPARGILPTSHSFSRAAAVALGAGGLQAVQRVSGEVIDQREAAYAAVFGYGLCVWGSNARPPLA